MDCPGAGQVARGLRTDATTSGLERLPVHFEDHPKLFHQTFFFFWIPYTIRSLNDPGPIKTIVQPAHYTLSRYASCGSASLQRQETGSLAHRVLSNSAPSPVFVFTPVATVDNSLQQPRVRVQFWVLIVFTTF